MRKEIEKAIIKFCLLVFSERTTRLARDDLRYCYIRLHNLVFLRKKYILETIRTGGHPLYLNLGSGTRGLKDSHWINIDGYKEQNVDFFLDFNRPFPFPDACFDGIFTEHVLEHFSREDGSALLEQCRRILKPGGIIRIIVPDGEKIMKAYFEIPDELIKHRRGFKFTMDAINSYFRQGDEHQYMYDYKTLKNQLDKSKFIDICSVCFRKGNNPMLLIDNEEYKWESLYMEAKKPV